MRSRIPSPLARHATRLILALLAAIAPSGCERPASSGPFSEPDYEFGEVLQGNDVEHAFAFRNATDRELRIRRVGATDGVKVVSLDSVVAPGASGTLRVRVPTTNRRGEVNELANVYAENPEKPIASLHVRGTVVLPIEVTPRRQAYFFTLKGERAQQTLTLVSYGARDLDITSVSSDNPSFAVREGSGGDGKRRTLTVTLDPSTPPGKHEGTITVATNNALSPRLTIPAFAQVKDSLSTSIDTVTFGQIAFDALDSEVLGRKSVRVSKQGSADFRVLGATTDLSFLAVEVVPHPSGAGFLVNLRVLPKHAKRGQLLGTLRITTNDPARPELRLPIRGNIV